jgi:hypothetical protein
MMVSLMCKFGVVYAAVRRSSMIEVNIPLSASVRIACFGREFYKCTLL